MTLNPRQFQPGPGQLSMFMTAREVTALPSVDTRPGWEPDTMWAHKRADNAADGLGAHVVANGVHAPVMLAHGLGDGPQLADGHHRAIAAFDHNPDSFVPVEHEDYSKRRTRLSPAMEDEHGAHKTKAPGWAPGDRFRSMP